MARDALATLLRLRGIEERVARAALAQDLAASHQAADAAAGAARAITTEAKGADPAHYAAWLPRGLAAREAAEATAAEAAEAAEAARRLLAEAHAARRVAEEAKARRDAETAARLATRTQHALDDMARRRLRG
jgi:hypothetical protein